MFKGCRGVVYTAIAKNYDFLRPVPSGLHKHLDFVCFTNDYVQGKVINGWTIRNLRVESGDQIRACRYVKACPHIFLDDYEFSIWLDGNISFNSALVDLLTPLLESGALMAGFRHPHRDCVYEEAQECKRVNKDSWKKIDDQMAILKDNGYPAYCGLTETNVLFRVHMDDDVIKHSNEWWKFISQFSRRDQLSFDYLIWKNGIYFNNFEGSSHSGNPVFKRGLHRSGNRIRRLFAFIESRQMEHRFLQLFVRTAYGARNLLFGDVVKRKRGS